MGGPLKSLNASPFLEFPPSCLLPRKCSRRRTIQLTPRVDENPFSSLIKTTPNSRNKKKLKQRRKVAWSYKREDSFFNRNIALNTKLQFD